MESAPTTPSRAPLTPRHRPIGEPGHNHDRAAALAVALSKSADGAVTQLEIPIPLEDDASSMDLAAEPHGTVFNECVHCGFCLPVCPTYDVLGTEMDSPRGRLYLMRGLETGRIEPTEA